MVSNGPNAVDKGGRIPLHYAALENDAERARAEIAAGADADKADKGGFAPLHFAAQEGAVEAAVVLLDAGAQIDPRNRYGNTPLWVGLLSPAGTPALLSLLRSRGADPFVENNNGKSVVDVLRVMANEEKRKVFADLL